ncbi:MAG: hypothetical protein ACI9FJ_001303 [Alteromonadaceae bacterium]|jgi:hypothetical protein
MNVKELMLDSLLASIEEGPQPCVESYIIDDIISNIALIRQSIELSKQLLNASK